MTADPRADRLIRRQERLKAERSSLESLWQEIGELIKPMRADFTIQRAPGDRRAGRIFDATPALAAENLAAGLWGMITNSANDWFALRHTIDDLNQERPVRLWLDTCAARMRDAFAADGQRFYAKVLELYQDLVSFGTGVFYVDEAPGGGTLRFSCRHLAECYIAENDQEQIDTLIRRFTFSARQAVQRWGDLVSAPILRCVEHDEAERRFSFLHAVLPVADWPAADEGFESQQPSERRFASIYVDIEGRTIVAEGGYFEFPYQIPRWSTSTRSLYGDSPALFALPDIKMLNAMSKTTIIAAQKIADPPILAPDEAAVRGVRTSPGGIIYGGIDAAGRRLYEPLATGGNINLGLEMEEQRRSAIREAFLFSLLVMVRQPNATATEVLARQEEKLRLMGPHLGRIQAEFLDPLIGRVFAIMSRAGAFPPPPPVLRDYPELRVTYVSPLARAQKASEGAAIVRTIEAMAPLAALKPELLDNFDGDEYARALAEAYGAPAKLLRDPRDVAALRAGRAALGAMQALGQEPAT